MALVTFPAASAVFTNPHDYGLSHTEFGGMFVPQAIMAVVFSLLGGRLKKRLGIKRLYMLGLFANLLAMGLLVVSRFVMRDHLLAYGALLVATGCMGIGFGLTVPALNTFVAAFFPQKVDRAVLVLNALLGLGTALAPIFIAIFVRLGIWWGLPALVGILLIGLLSFSATQPLRIEEPQKGRECAKRQYGDPCTVLDLRRLCPALRRVRNDERQLGGALHDRTFWSERRPGIARVGSVLGHGDRRAHPVRRHREMVPRTQWSTGPCRL